MGCGVECTVSAKTVSQGQIDTIREYTHLIVDATPPLRIVFACSVKAVSFDSGYSIAEEDALLFLGVMKNARPIVDYFGPRPNQILCARSSRTEGLHSRCSDSQTHSQGNAAPLSSAASLYLLRPARLV